jgi:hypothetical protein
MQEKKVLSIEEIEAQTPLELPDRTLMNGYGAENESTINIAIQIITLIFDLWFPLREKQRSRKLTKQPVLALVPKERAPGQCMPWGLVFTTFDPSTPMSPQLLRSIIERER